MNARLYDRLAAFASIAFLLILGAGTYYLAIWAERPAGTAIETQSNVPDMFVEGVSLTRVDHTGEPVFQMSADSMMHFPFDGSSEFRAPVLVSLDPQRPKLTVRADTATATSDAAATVLSGNVILERQANSEAPVLVVRTERLVLSSDSETARTDLPVSIMQGSAHLTGIGMEFNNLEQTFRLSAQVRGVWPGSGETLEALSPGSVPDVAPGSLPGSAPGSAPAFSPDTTPEASRQAAPDHTSGTTRDRDLDTLRADARFAGSAP